ncbi:LysR family transcriptional regulator [Clostridium vitabionis]|uniref:LysR family transcriptional regulator n=1 Tax=Clostridium vitabionis TaxID=2784388 RepID=UPI00188C080A|nr:LysR family transcriptional regulator [Clostridium vitabionis]
MELLQLQYFIEVVQQQSVTKAAEKLHISQPSLSQSLHRLQQEVGISIFQKDGRKLRLTESGRTFYLRIANALQAITNACEEANGTILQGNILIGT